VSLEVRVGLFVAAQSPQHEDAKEGLESRHFHADDILLELLLKESCFAALEGKSLTF
jgi:hypothetical protein